MIITANLVTSAQLDNWMQQNRGRLLATADEWCWVANNAFPQSTGVCPSLDTTTLIACGMLSDGSNRNSMPQITSVRFLSALTNSQELAGTTTQGPPQSGSSGSVVGSSTGGANSPAKTTNAGTVGQGVLGPTSCSVCQQFSKNPILLVVLAVAVYFLFFDGKME